MFRPDTINQGRIRISNSEQDHRAWDRFLFGFSGAHYFQTYGWLKSYEVLGLTPNVLLYEIDGKIEGGVAFLRAKVPILPLQLFIIPHGPLPSDPNAPGWLPLMKRVDEICCESSAVYAQIYPHEVSDQSVLLPRLEEMGFISPPLFTAHRFSSEPVTVDLHKKTEDEVLKSIRERTRTYVRRALNSDLELRTNVDQVTFDKIYQLFMNHGLSRGFRPRPYASLRTVWEWFSVNGGATFIQAWRGDKLVGANFVLFTGRRAYYIHGAVDRDYAEQRPAEFLHWHSIRTAIKLNLEKYDLVNLGPEGVEQFKRGFRPHHQIWHGPRAKVYRPATAKLASLADTYLRPVLRGLVRRRVNWKLH
jgi:hypothetical protein